MPWWWKKGSGPRSDLVTELKHSRCNSETVIGKSPKDESSTCSRDYAGEHSKRDSSKSEGIFDRVPATKVAWTGSETVKLVREDKTAKDEKREEVRKAKEQKKTLKLQEKKSREIQYQERLRRKNEAMELKNKYTYEAKLIIDEIEERKKQIKRAKKMQAKEEEQRKKEEKRLAKEKNLRKSGEKK